MRKYTTADSTSTKIVSKEGHQAIADTLRKVGKTSAQDLSDEERKDLPHDEG